MESVKVTSAGQGKQFQTLSPQDRNLVTISTINTNFGQQGDYIELHIYNELGEILLNDYDATDYYPTLNNPKNNTYSSLELDPETDVKNRGFNRGNLSVQYNFYKRLFNSGFGTLYWIKEVSFTRTELKLASQVLSDASIRSSFAAYQNYIASKNYYPIFYLNFGNNQTVIATNAAYTQDDEGAYILVKLYEPLPSNFDVKSQLWLVDKIADSVSFDVSIEVFAEQVADPNALRGPNYNVKLNTKTGQTTPYYNYNNLVLSPVTSSYQKMKSFYQDKAIQLNVDYSDFSNFVHFSSAVQRVNNFVYKLQLIESASAVISSQMALVGGGSVASSSISVEQKFIDNTIKNFDIYEYFLYFESSSFAWPKSNSTQPYNLYSVTSSEAQNFLGSETTVPSPGVVSLLFSASYYDSTNKDTLHQSIPQYVLDDPSNQPFITFLDMIGQHFDNIWVYYKDVSNRFDATNNPSTGISLDLVSDALKGLGTQLYTNTNVSDNLYYTMFGINPDGSLLPPTGSEWITNYVTSSLATLPAETLQDEIYKRLYHNLPYLLKTKGTARGIKSIISSYGIPESMLKVREYGGNFYNELDGVLDLDSSDYKIIIDTGSFAPSPTYVLTEILEYIQGENSDFVVTDYPIDQGTVTGSLEVSSSLLSPYTTLQYYIGNRRLNSTNLEIGFSPSDTINSNIVASQGTFVIDQLVGSPGYRYSSSYEPLVSASNAYFSSYTQPNSIWEYVRLLKFYNNSLFKIIKDFVPARANVSTGIIIKSHLYERNKYARHEPSMSVLILSQSIDMIEISGSDGDSINGNTYWSGYLTSPSGSVFYNSSNNIEKYTGELSGSYLRPTSGKAFPQVEISQRPAPFIYNELIVSESGQDYITSEISYLLETEDQVGNPYYVFPIYALYQNVTSSVRSEFLLDLDYTGDQLKPINYGAITQSINQYQIDNYATYTNPNNPYAQVQDYNYSLQRSLIPRYSGSKTVSSTYSEYTAGDQSYGQTAAIDKIKFQYAYIVDIFSSSFQLPGRAKGQIKYIIDNDQNVLNLSKTNTNIFTVQNIFRSGEWADVSLFDYDPTNPYINKLNNSDKDFTIWESGYIYTPVLYNIGGSGSLNFNLVIASSSTSTTTVPSYTNVGPGQTNYWTIDSPITAFTAPYYSPPTAIPGRFGITASAVVGGTSVSESLISFTVTNTLRGGTFTGQFIIPSASTSYKTDIYTSPTAPYDTWLVSDGLTITTTQQSYNPNGGTSTSNTYITSVTDTNPCLWIPDDKTILLSQVQSANYGNIILNSTQSLMDPTVFPVDLQSMDLIRLYNTSSGFSINSEYRIKSTVYPYQSASVNYVALTLDRPINTSDVSGSSIPGKACKYMILKRLVDETAVTFNYDLPQPITNDGVLFPQYIQKDVKENSGNVIKALKQQNLI